MQRRTIITMCPSWPGQFKSVINACARDHNIVAVCQVAKPEYIACHDNLTILHDLPFSVGAFSQNAIEFATGVIRIKRHLKDRGIVPDIALIQSGFGIEALSDVLFPDIPVIGYFEWYSTGESTTHDTFTHPANMLMNAESVRFANRCSVTIVPTRFQRAQFPLDVRKRMLVVHEGIDTDFFSPAPLRKEHPFSITYVSRGLEKARGVMQFFSIVVRVLAQRPSTIVKVVGEDKCFYEQTNTSYRNEALKLLGPVLSKRVEFLGVVSKEGVRDVLQSSDLHVYFAEPRGISWSVLEALSCGCLTMISNLDGLKEVIGDAKHCLPVDHNDIDLCVAKTIDIIDDPNRWEHVRVNARNFVLSHFDAKAGGDAWRRIVAALI